MTNLLSLDDHDDVADLLHQGPLEPIVIVAERHLGERPSGTTIWRWRKGLSSGIKLPAIHALNGWRTTSAAFLNFLERRSEVLRQPRTQSSVPADTAKQ